MVRYKDLAWVKDIRRWPPPLVSKLTNFLKRDATS